MPKNIKKQHDKLKNYENYVKQSKQRKLTIADIFRGKCHYCKSNYSLDEESIICGFKTCSFCYQEAMCVIYADGTYNIDNSPFYMEHNSFKNCWELKYKKNSF